MTSICQKVLVPEICRSARLADPPAPRMSNRAQQRTNHPVTDEPDTPR